MKGIGQKKNMTLLKILIQKTIDKLVKDNFEFFSNVLEKVSKIEFRKDPYLKNVIGQTRNLKKYAPEFF